jgi:predicted peptidase
MVRSGGWNNFIDTNRVYAEGISFGANGCFTFAMEHPEMFAAIDVTGGISTSVYADVNPNVL